MMNNNLTAYLDCFSGISGDMFLGALLHAGYPETELRKTIDALQLSGYELSILPKKSHGISSITVDITHDTEQHYRHLKSIATRIRASGLPAEVIEISCSVFTELARAEAKIHAMDIEQVHFHEVGAVDTIIDIVGVVAGLQYLGIDKLICSPLPSPRGFVTCAHGRLPLPAPAVCELLKQVPTYGVPIDKEMVTPTGAALIKVLVKEFGNQPHMEVSANGYGSGSHHFEDRPNLLRLLVGKEATASEYQQVAVVETNLDDWNPELFPHLSSQLFANGALDVSITPILMKKGRPAHTVSVLCPPNIVSEISQVLFLETTTIGVRHRLEYRHTLVRTIIEIHTPWGPLKAKQVETPQGLRIYPEYEECLRAAKQSGAPLQQIYDHVRKIEIPR